MLEKMRPIIAEQLNVQESEIKENTKLKEDLGADSLDLLIPKYQQKDFMN